MEVVFQCLPLQYERLCITKWPPFQATQPSPPPRSKEGNRLFETTEYLDVSSECLLPAGSEFTLAPEGGQTSPLAFPGDPEGPVSPCSLLACALDTLSCSNESKARFGSNSAARPGVVSPRGVASLPDPSLSQASVLAMQIPLVLPRLRAIALRASSNYFIFFFRVIRAILDLATPPIKMLRKIYIPTLKIPTHDEFKST